MEGFQQTANEFILYPVSRGWGAVTDTSSEQMKLDNSGSSKLDIPRWRRAGDREN